MTVPATSIFIVPNCDRASTRPSSLWASRATASGPFPTTAKSRSSTAVGSNMSRTVPPTRYRGSLSRAAATATARTAPSFSAESRDSSKSPTSYMGQGYGL